MTTLPRAATAPELVKLRSDNQSSRLYLTVHAPATVFTARLAALPSSNDNVSAVSYNSGSGAGYTDIFTDMRVDIGTTAGAYDLGTTRILNLSGLGAVTGTLNIERTSEIQWSANCYITVLDAFDLRARPPYVDGSGTLFMDTSVAYSDQHTKCKSTPIFPRYHVKWLPAGGTVQVVEDSTQSWALNNTINAWAWTAPGNSAISGDSTDTCTITYDTANAHAGYRVQLDLTNTDNVDSTGYGRVFVLSSESDAITQFSIESIEGTYQDGGWSAQITMYAECDRATIRDRALCIIHRKDWYGKTASDEGSIGYISGDENIELVGWISGESIRWLPDGAAGTVTFTIHGPQYWLDHLTMPPVGLKNISSHPPTNWKRFTGLTAKSMTWHILHWRTTAPVMMDCFAANSTVGALQFQSSGAQTVWQQISNVLDDFILAKPCCDSYARLFMQTEQNLLSSAARSSIPTVMTVTKADWENEIDFDRRVVNDIAGVDLNGEIYDGTNTTEVYALCPGRTFASRGMSIYQRTRLAITDQSSLNTLAGAAFGWQNNPYPNWQFVLPSNLHLIDLAPYQYLGISIASGDTPRNFTASGMRLIPRSIRRVFQDGYIKTEVGIEAESPIGAGIIGDTPPAPPDPPAPPPPIVPPVPPVPVPPGNAREKWFATTTELIWAGDYFNGGQPTWTLATGLPSFTVITWFGITPTGTAYLCVDGGVGTDTIYTSTTPKTGGWTAILTRGDSLDGGHTAYNFARFQLTGSTLSTMVFAIEDNGQWYSVYNGTSWTHVHTGFAMEPGSMFATAYVDGYSGTTGATLRNPGGGAIASWSKDFGAEMAGQCWQNQIGGVRYDIASQSGIVRLINCNTGAVVYNTGLADGANTEGVYVTGAHSGPHIYFVSFTSGQLFLSDDGSTFSNPATWRAGIVHDAQLTGGGALSWTLLSATIGNEFDRISSDRGATWSAMTGNIWSLIAGITSLRGVGLVYV